MQRKRTEREIERNGLVLKTLLFWFACFILMSSCKLISDFGLNRGQECSEYEVLDFSVSLGGTEYRDLAWSWGDGDLSIPVPLGSDLRNIVASFELSAGARLRIGRIVQTSGLSENDYTNPVSYIVEAPDGREQEFHVVISALLPEQLLISEYFRATDGILYVELANKAETTINLGEYALRRICYDGTGVRNTGCDGTIELSGLLAAGKVLVVYDERMDTETTPPGESIRGLAPERKMAVAGTAESFMGLDGNDCVLLIHQGVTVDRIGPHDGSYFADKAKYIRKQGATASPRYNSGDWLRLSIVGDVEDDDTAGIYASGGINFATEGIRQFVFTEPSKRISYRGRILSTDIIAELPEGSDASDLMGEFFAYSTAMRVGEAPIEGNSVRRDFFNPVRFELTEMDGRAFLYDVFALVTPSIDYVSDNYEFNGGIAAAHVALDGASSMQNLDGSGLWEVISNPGSDRIIAGIVTLFSRDSNWLVLQDRDGAVRISGHWNWLRTLEPRIKIGDRVSITNCRAGSSVDGRIEIDRFGPDGNAAPSYRLEAVGTRIYYVEATWVQDTALEVVRYHGMITWGPSDTLVGIFDGDSSKRFLALGASLPMFSMRDFYGVLDYYSPSSSQVPMPHILLRYDSQIKKID